MHFIVVYTFPYSPQLVFFVIGYFLIETKWLFYLDFIPGSHMDSILHFLNESILDCHIQNNSCLPQGGPTSNKITASRTTAPIKGVDLSWFCFPFISNWVGRKGIIKHCTNKLIWVFGVRFHQIEQKPQIIQTATQQTSAIAETRKLTWLRFLSVFLNLKICSDGKGKKPQKISHCAHGVKNKDRRKKKKKTDFNHHAIPDCQISWLWLLIKTQPAACI